MRIALGLVVALGVGIAVTAALWASDYSAWESILVGVFSALPVFLLGAWWAERRVV